MCRLIPRLATLMVLSVHLLHVSSAQLEADKRSGSRYCGRYLVQALQVVCNGVYNSPFVSKKSIGHLIPPESLVPSDPDGGSSSVGDGGGGENTALWLLRDWFPYRQETRRVARGVHDECCRNSCTFQQLQMYCGRR